MEAGKLESWKASTATKFKSPLYSTSQVPIMTSKYTPIQSHLIHCSFPASKQPLPPDSESHVVTLYTQLAHKFKSVSDHLIFRKNTTCDKNASEYIMITDVRHGSQLSISTHSLSISPIDENGSLMREVREE